MAAALTLALVLALAAVLVGLSAALPLTAVRAQQTDGAGELVHYGDIIDVDVVGSFEFDWRGRLTPEGFLDGYDRIEDPVFALCTPESAVAEATPAIAHV